MKTTKKYYINALEVTKKEFEGYLYLIFCRLQNDSRTVLMDLMQEQNEKYNYSKNFLDDALLKQLKFKD